MPASGQITRWLQKLYEGDDAALEHLVPLLYDELRVIARKQLRNERSGHTLSTTDLVNEAYLRLVDQRQLRAENRPQFFAIAATTMRRILVDYARARRCLKRGGGQHPISLEEAERFLTDAEADELIALDAALDRLATLEPRAAEVVQCRFYSGLTLNETARHWTSRPKPFDGTGSRPVPGCAKRSPPISDKCRLSTAASGLPCPHGHT